MDCLKDLECLIRLFLKFEAVFFNCKKECFVLGGSFVDGIFYENLGQLWWFLFFLLRCLFCGFSMGIFYFLWSVVSFKGYVILSCIYSASYLMPVYFFHLKYKQIQEKSLSRLAVGLSSLIKHHCVLSKTKSSIRSFRSLSPFKQFYSGFSWSSSSNVSNYWAFLLFFTLTSYGQTVIFLLFNLSLIDTTL